MREGLYESLFTAPARSGGARAGADCGHGAANGWRFLLFVRERSREPFVALGAARYLSHSGNRPMGVVWQLDHAMPAAVFDRFAAHLPG